MMKKLLKLFILIHLLLLLIDYAKSEHERNGNAQTSQSRSSKSTSSGSVPIHSNNNRPSQYQPNLPLQTQNHFSHSQPKPVSQFSSPKPNNFPMPQPKFQPKLNFNSKPQFQPQSLQLPHQSQNHYQPLSLSPQLKPNPITPQLSQNSQNLETKPPQHSQSPLLNTHDYHQQSASSLSPTAHNQHDHLYQNAPPEYSSSKQSQPNDQNYYYPPATENPSSNGRSSVEYSEPPPVSSSSSPSIESNFEIFTDPIGPKPEFLAPILSDYQSNIEAVPNINIIYEPNSPLNQSPSDRPLADSQGPENSLLDYPRYDRNRSPYPPRSRSRPPPYQPIYRNERINQPRYNQRDSRPQYYPRHPKNPRHSPPRYGPLGSSSPPGPTPVSQNLSRDYRRTRNPYSDSRRSRGGSRGHQNYYPRRTHHRESYKHHEPRDQYEQNEFSGYKDPKDIFDGGMMSNNKKDDDSDFAFKSSKESSSKDSSFEPMDPSFGVGDSFSSKDSSYDRESRDSRDSRDSNNGMYFDREFDDHPNERHEDGFKLSYRNSIPEEELNVNIGINGNTNLRKHEHYDVPTEDSYRHYLNSPKEYPQDQYHKKEYPKEYPKKDYPKKPTPHYHKPIPAAIDSKHSIETYHKKYQKQGYSHNPTVDINSGPLPLTLRFNSYSTNIHAIQYHKSPEGKVQKSSKVDEPDLLIQTVKKPVIQEIREIIQPVRQRTQEVRPVYEKIETVIARGDTEMYKKKKHKDYPKDQYKDYPKDQYKDYPKDYQKDYQKDYAKDSHKDRYHKDYHQGPYNQDYQYHHVPDPPPLSSMYYHDEGDDFPSSKSSSPENENFHVKPPLPNIPKWVMHSQQDASSSNYKHESNLEPTDTWSKSDPNGSLLAHSDQNSPPLDNSNQEMHPIR